MYRKALSLLLLCNLIILMGIVCAVGIARAEQDVGGPALLRMEELEIRAGRLGVGMVSDNRAGVGIGIADVAISEQRVVNYSLVEQGEYRFLEEEELEVLQRIVEAEAGSEDEDGKLLVANVVLNRVDSDRFPETVTEVVFQQSKGVSQFSPAASGRIYSVKVSEETVAAVERALAGEDISQGALFFASRRYASSSKMRWFDEKLTFLFRHGGHEFYK
ncbi:MAG: cell wall hydrolase [Butyrivibrio sp.]|nr:cell wall hydrolase [Acetatifactor muris]MCM1560508.1 cell wall hydrolase [Butyrivibrio sp.]